MSEDKDLRDQSQRPNNPVNATETTASAQKRAIINRVRFADDKSWDAQGLEGVRNQGVVQAHGDALVSKRNFRAL
jgi:hypothetical protein